MQIPAISISVRAARILRPGVAGRVLASFERVCDLVTDAGEVVALVWDGIGNGPLNIALAQGPGVSLPAGTRFAVEPTGETFGPGRIGRDSAPIQLTGVLAVDRRGGPAVTQCGDSSAGFVKTQPPADVIPAKAGIQGRTLDSRLRGNDRFANTFLGQPLRIDLSSAVPWNPQPDWQLLRARRRQIVAGAGLIAGLLAAAGWSPARCGLPASVCEQAARGQPAAICALVGLGPGLTPAGDDWLAGWLLAQHISADLRDILPEITTEARKARRFQRQQIAEIAAERTTTLSRAFLACAAAGEADAAWHALFSALTTEPMTNLPIYQFTEAILSHGATSGAAMLTGFCAGVAYLNPDS